MESMIFEYDTQRELFLLNYELKFKNNLGLGWMGDIQTRSITSISSEAVWNHTRNIYANIERLKRWKRKLIELRNLYLEIYMLCLFSMTYTPNRL